MEDQSPATSLLAETLIVDRVRGEYLEMPGLRLTLPQAQRLFGLDALACALVFETLTREKFLSRGRDGRFAQ